MKSAADELGLIDQLVSDDELTPHILNGLSSSFENISAAFRTRDTVIWFEELRDKLVENDNYVKRMETQFEDVLSVPMLHNVQHDHVSSQSFKPMISRFLLA